MSLPPGSAPGTVARPAMGSGRWAALLLATALLAACAGAALGQEASGDGESEEVQFGPRWCNEALGRVMMTLGHLGSNDPLKSWPEYHGSHGHWSWGLLCYLLPNVPAKRDG